MKTCQHPEKDCGQHAETCACGYAVDGPAKRLTIRERIVEALDPFIRTQKHNVRWSLMLWSKHSQSKETKMADEQEPGPTTTEFPILSGLADGQDAVVALNMRDWLQKACEAKGAKMVEGGVGCGGADIDIELEGCRYNVFIQAIVR